LVIAIFLVMWSVVWWLGWITAELLFPGYEAPGVVGSILGCLAGLLFATKVTGVRA
jgi:hypothetical protein